MITTSNPNSMYTKNDCEKTKEMETTVINAPFNETQMFLLQVFAQIKSEEERNDIQTMLLDYYRKRVDFHASEISLSNEKIEEILNSHYRTPYK